MSPADRASFNLDARAGQGDLLREALVTFFRDRRKVLAAFLLPVALAGIAAAIMTPRFEATASLLVRPGREYVYRPETGEGQQISFAEKSVLGAEVAILTSRDLIGAAIAEIGRERLFPRRDRLGATLDWLGVDRAAIADWVEERRLALGWAPAAEKPLDRDALAVEQFLERLDAEVPENANVLALSFRHRDGEVAADALNVLVNLYMGKRRNVFLDDRSRFAAVQVGDLERQLSDAEGAIAEFKQGHAIAAFEKQREQLIDIRGALEGELLEVEAVIADHRSRIDALRQKLSELDPVVTLYAENLPDDAVDRAKERLLDLNLKLRDLRARYRENNTLVRNARDEVRRAEAYLTQLRGERQDVVRRGRNEVHDNLRATMLELEAAFEAAQARRAVVNEQLVMATTRLADLDSRERRLNELQRQRRSLESNFFRFNEVLVEEQAREHLNNADLTNVRLIQPATPPAKPRSYRRLVVALGMFGGLVAAALSAFLAALWRDDFATPETLERATGLPVIATVDLR